jgi:hypothetical protein
MEWNGVSCFLDVMTAFLPKCFLWLMGEWNINVICGHLGGNEPEEKMDTAHWFKLG